MLIYQSERTVITTTETDHGHVAEKRHGKSEVQHMPYYPERDIAPLAGCIDEETAWQILKDVAQLFIPTEKQESAEKLVRTPILPEHILIDGPHFLLASWSRSRDVRFEAPEGYEPRWALAATVFYIFLGCPVFQGGGGKAQTATTPIPTLRSELQALSSLLAQCLNFHPENRPTMEEILRCSTDNLKRCQSASTTPPPLKSGTRNMPEENELDKIWPEEML